MVKNNIAIIAILLSITLYGQAGKVGINTTSPTTVLDVNGDLRVRQITPSTSTSDVALVADANGVIKKKASEVKGIMRAYLSDDFTTGTTSGTIYKVLNWNEIDDPGSNFDTSSGLFVAPVTGVYRITYSAAATWFVTSFPTYTYGLVQASDNSWVIRFTIPQSTLSDLAPSGNAVGVSNSFVGLATLQQGQTYYFGATGYQRLVAKPSGTSGSGLGSYFEIQLVQGS